jgi:HPt (histidine-containing phosphotransfer) domain-containing protein
MGGIYADLPIIALTANAVLGAKEMFLSNGFNDFISKPIDSKELAFIIREWLPPDKVTLVTKDPDKTASKINPDLARFFNKKLLSECEKMSQFLRADNLHGFAVAVHAMKSSLAIIGETMLSNVAQELETAAKNGKLRFCKDYYQKLEIRLKELHERLSVIFPEVLPQGSDIEKDTGTKSALTELVEKTIAAAEDFDGDAGLEHLNALQKLDFGAEINDMILEALSAFNDFDFDKATNILRSILTWKTKN